jgi:hypothetical protein
MPTYKVDVFQLAICTYYVQADRPEEAICRAGTEEHSTLIKQEVLNERVDEYGMSFEAAKSLGIDVEKLRVEHNFDRNHEHIEAIESIDVVHE